MDQTTLKYLRLIIPGILIMLGAYPVYYYYLGKAYDIKGLDITYLTYVSILLGGIYYQLNIQKLITKPSHYLITNNILKMLIKAYGRNVSDEEKESLKFKDNYMRVFYHVIDNDESLKRKGDNVRFNGIFWTSTADSSLISLMFYLLYTNFEEVSNHDILKLAFGISAIVSFFLHIISVAKHISLSNEQLKPIVHDRSLSMIVKTKFDEILH